MFIGAIVCSGLALAFGVATVRAARQGRRDIKECCGAIDRSPVECRHARTNAWLNFVLMSFCATGFAFGSLMSVTWVFGLYATAMETVVTYAAFVPGLLLLAFMILYQESARQQRQIDRDQEAQAKTAQQ